MFRGDAATGAGSPAPAPGHSDGGTTADAAAPTASLLDLHKGLSTPARGPLGLKEGIDHPERIEDPRTGCLRWPEHQRLLNVTTGELVMGRCRSTNLCRYCQTLYVLETVEMLTLDALEYPPTLYAVLTAREHLTRADCRRHLERLLRSCRRKWPAAEWFVQVEFQRRGALHLNLLVKGVAVEDAQALQEHIGTRWCARVDAEMPWAVVVTEVSQADGLVRYLQKTLSHGLKAEQAPPIGWRGHRTSQTRGYLVRPASVMRQEARAALKVRREVWRALQNGYRGHDAELVAQLELQRQELDVWRLYSSRKLLAGPSNPPGAPGVHPRAEDRIGSCTSS